MMIKHFSILIIVAFFVAGVAAGQSADEMKTIETAAKSDYLDQKETALKLIGKAIEQGNTDDKLREILEYLALEGTQNKNNARGGNFSKVRSDAVKHLGKMGTAEAKNSLLKVCKAEYESMVLSDAIIALGLIGINEDNDVVSMLVLIGNKNNASPALDNKVALATIITLEKLAQKYKTVDADTMQLLGKMLEGQYLPQVKQKAREAINNMRGYVNS